jgi:hypothetical protein
VLFLGHAKSAGERQNERALQVKDGRESKRAASELDGLVGEVAAARGTALPAEDVRAARHPRRARTVVTRLR